MSLMAESIPSNSLNPGIIQVIAQRSVRGVISMTGIVAFRVSRTDFGIGLSCSMSESTGPMMLVTNSPRSKLDRAETVGDIGGIAGAELERLGRGMDPNQRFRTSSVVRRDH